MSGEIAACHIGRARRGPDFAQAVGRLAARQDQRQAGGEIAIEQRQFGRRRRRVGACDVAGVGDFGQLGRQVAALAGHPEHNPAGDRHRATQGPQDQPVDGAMSCGEPLADIGQRKQHRHDAVQDVQLVGGVVMQVLASVVFVGRL